MYSNHISLNNDTYNVFFYSNLRMFLTCSQLDSDHMDLLAALTLPHACTRVQRGGYPVASVCAELYLHRCVWADSICVKPGSGNESWKTRKEVERRSSRPQSSVHTHTNAHTLTQVCLYCNSLLT